MPLERPVGICYEVKRVAVLLDMSERWVKEEVKRGNLVGYRLGHKIVISGQSLIKYLEEHKI